MSLMECPDCGNQVSDKAVSCPKCGFPVSGTADPAAGESRSWIVAMILSAFWGALGIDRFYLGRTGTAILKLITFGGFAIWWLIDFILIVMNKLPDGHGKALVKPEGA